MRAGELVSAPGADTLPPIPPAVPPRSPEAAARVRAVVDAIGAMEFPPSLEDLERLVLIEQFLEPLERLVCAVEVIADAATRISEHLARDHDGR